MTRFPEKISTDKFELLMHTIADRWNEGDARKVADCFSEDAFYLEPPETALSRPRRTL